MDHSLYHTKAPPHGDVEELERKRLQLEENVAKLSKALRHWQSWEVEYAEFKDAVQALPPDAAPADLRSTGESLESSLLTRKEIDELLGSRQGKARDRDQVVGVIARRVDYVQQNAQSVQKQLDKAERELETALEGPADATSASEELPVMEILEELDDDGNVVSSSVSSAKDAVPGVVEVLKRAGVAGLEASKENEKLQGTASDDQKAMSEAGSKHPVGPTKMKSPDAQSFTQATLAPPNGTDDNSKKRKKSVSFAEEISISTAPSWRSSSPPPQALPPTPIRPKHKDSWEVEEARKGRFFSGTRVIEVDDNDREIGSLPVVAPEDESPEDAALRHEMNQYALSEVGAVVAEMNIEEDHGEYDEDEENFEDDPEYEPGSDEEEENEAGISTRDRVTDEDRQAMLDLERRLNAKMMENIGPRPEPKGITTYSDDLRTLVIRSNEKDGGANKDKKSQPAKKGVHFAAELDISPPPTEATRADNADIVPSAPPVSDAVVERSDNTKVTEDAKSTPQKKTSRFKKTRMDKNQPSADAPALPLDDHAKQALPSIPIHLQQPPQLSHEIREPEGPTGQTLSTEVIERPVREGAVAPPDETGTDPALLEQELAVANRRLLNRTVQKQGGFKPSAEDEENPLMEERDGKVRKVSRFKAARLNA
ncbi:hypothetical protein NA57DRAFT_57557 [Rhizodiscina lignyota]|uniref:DUF3835 domain-containing protein n=1 Tax=Rhizodiscina lignyota TaxID=1504668 RepID=A0A9P4IE86_9PEZI|nr:hypothetical protein NA57DRAFT_57557 [Rhizodiscina lignyota]